MTGGRSLKITSCVWNARSRS